MSRIDLDQNENRPKPRSRGSDAARRHRVRLRILRRILITVLLMALSFGAGFGMAKFSDEDFLTRRKYVDLSALVAPDWINQQFIPVGKYARPGIKMERINDVVIHYVANPGTTAEQNRSYFEGLENQTDSSRTYASCHFIIGLDGEIIQIIPMDEKAYASNNRNSDTVAIECCHPGEDGRFTDETMSSLVKLTAWILHETDLKEKNVIRHYDVNGKVCPKYYVDHEDAWEQFLADVKRALKEYR